MSWDEAREQQCERAATLLADAEGANLVQLLQQLELLRPLKPRIQSEPVPPETDHISIWTRKTSGDRVYYQRPPVSRLGDHYADRISIEAEKSRGTRRVCFFGESVAAGYLYAPRVTPAKILARQLNGMTPEPYEVIDLSRTNERLATMTQTIEQAMQLDPDVLVVFAGNNWNLLETPETSALSPDPTSRRSFGEILGRGGTDGVINEAGRRQIDRINRCYARIAEMARNRNIPVVLVIPQVNLIDWETMQPPMALPDQQLTSWHTHFQRARKALEEHDWEKAKVQAMAMLDLDGGTCSTSFRVLAHAYHGDDRPEQAREAMTAEIDSAHYATLCFLSAPQISTFGQNMLRRLAHLHGMKMVDLAHLFLEHTGGSLTDRGLFLDYCHLTSEGMHVAMAAVTEKILSDEKLHWLDVLHRAPGIEISPETEAIAAMGAALHTSHRGCFVKPKHELLVYWFRKALSYSPSIVHTFLDYAHARLARVPEVLTAAQGRNLASLHPLSLQHGWRYDHLDAQALLAMHEALADHPEKRGELEHMLRDAARKACDLLDPALLWEPLHRFFPEVMGFNDLPRHAYYRAPWIESSFTLLYEGVGDITLELCPRLPLMSQGEQYPVSLAIDDKIIASVSAGKTWLRQTVTLKESQLKPGINKLTLHWPVPPTLPSEPLEQVSMRLLRGDHAEMHPVYGELFTLRTRKVTAEQ